jgi:hypothetical protein
MMAQKRQLRSVAVGAGEMLSVRGGLVVLVPGSFSVGFSDSCVDLALTLLCIPVSVSAGEVSSTLTVFSSVDTSDFPGVGAIFTNLEDNFHFVVMRLLVSDCQPKGHYWKEVLILI